MTTTISACCGAEVETRYSSFIDGNQYTCTKCRLVNCDVVERPTPTETGKRQKCRCYINLKTYGRAASKGGAMRGYKPCPVPGHENNSIPPTETVSDKLINDFIGRWVKPENRPYLLDDDDNPGQRLRVAISKLLQNERIEGYKDGYIKGGINQANNNFFVEDKV